MPIKYIPYTPTTVEGQAVLNTITRTQRMLRYRENDTVFERIERGMPFYETEVIESVNQNATNDSKNTSGNNPINKNLLIRGECISACAYLKENNIKIDLVYIDPPFASGADYAKKVYLRKNPKLAEKIEQAEQELDIEGLKAFEEKMYGDIWKKEDYLNWMYENLKAIKDVMSDTASIYLHIDWHIGHYIKVMMDEIFGEDNFINEIIWHYTGNSMPVKSFPKKHDNIFVYSKNEDFFLQFDDILIPYSEATLRRYNHTDKDGRKYKISTLAKGKTETIYAKEGKIPDSVWEIPLVRQISEKVDYSTQKPEALLERILKASSAEGMIVADFFGGSGVTAKVANDLGRNFVHVDVGINSIQTARDRLKDSNAIFDILEIQDGVSLFRNPQQTMDKLAQLITGLQQNVEGISSFWFGAITTSKEGTVPVYVPNLLNSQEKVLDIPMINTILNQELQKLEELEPKKVIVYYIDIEDRKEIEQFVKTNNMTLINIELKDLKNLLTDVVLEDKIEANVKMLANPNKESEKNKENQAFYEVEITKFFSDRLQQKINAFNEKGNLQAITKGKQFSPIDISEEGLELIELLALDSTNAEGEWKSNTEIKIDKNGFVAVNGTKTKDFWNGKITSSEKPKRLKVRNISGDETIFPISNV